MADPPGPILGEECFRLELVHVTVLVRRTGTETQREVHRLVVQDAIAGTGVEADAMGPRLELVVLVLTLHEDQPRGVAKVPLLKNLGEDVVVGDQAVEQLVVGPASSVVLSLAVSRFAPMLPRSVTSSFTAKFPARAKPRWTFQLPVSSGSGGSVATAPPAPGVVAATAGVALGSAGVALPAGAAGPAAGGIGP